jgi:hypothetical protein
MILEAASEFKLSKDSKNTNHWWDDECKRVIQGKNEARKKCLIRRTRANLDNYQQKRTKANRICRRKKKEWLDNKIKEINEINRNRDTRKLYKEVRNLSNQPSAMTLVCKDKDDNILSERKQMLERWQQYFKELLNPEIKRINNIEIHENSINNLEQDEPTNEEINKIIKNLKSNKAAGPGDILPEFIKKWRFPTKTENIPINSEDMETRKNSI